MRQQLNFFTSFIKKEKPAPLKRIATVFLFVFLIMLGSYVVFQVQLLMIKKGISDKQDILDNYTKIQVQYLADIKQKVEMLLTFQEQISKTEKAIGEIDYLGMELLERFFANVPAGIIFDSFSLGRGDWNIAGTADSWIAIAEFEHNLRADSFFGTFQLPGINPKNERYVFNLSGTFDKGAMKREN